MTAAYPLHWPAGFPRTTAPGKSKFSTSLAGALANVDNELRLFGVDTGKTVGDVVISSNVTLGRNNPTDAGIAVYFRWDGIDCAIAVDRYRTVAENVQAIAKVVEAHRAVMRHGGLNILRGVMRGHAALPPPTGPDGRLEPPWWRVLEFEAEPRELVALETRWRELVKRHHPDHGGDPATFNRITDAMRAGRAAVKP